CLPNFNFHHIQGYQYKTCITLAVVYELKYDCYLHVHLWSENMCFMFAEVAGHARPEILNEFKYKLNYKVYKAIVILCYRRFTITYVIEYLESTMGPAQ
ncbi:hypothetical protein ACJX0J_020176, partial [Zea mays]